MNDELQKRFDAAMMNVYENAKSRCNYPANYLRNSVCDRGGVATAKSLLGKNNVSYGFAELWECGCLEISVECLVLCPEFRILFSDEELQTARMRLSQCGFDPANCEK